MSGQWNSTKVRSLDVVMHFGKHKGKNILWIIQNDPAYIEWATAQKKPVLVFTKDFKKRYPELLITTP